MKHSLSTTVFPLVLLLSVGYAQAFDSSKTKNPAALGSAIATIEGMADHSNPTSPSASQRADGSSLARSSSVNSLSPKPDSAPTSPTASVVAKLPNQAAAATALYTTATGNVDNFRPASPVRPPVSSTSSSVSAVKPSEDLYAVDNVVKAYATGLQDSTVSTREASGLVAKLADTICTPRNRKYSQGTLNRLQDAHAIIDATLQQNSASQKPSELKSAEDATKPSSASTSAKQGSSISSWLKGAKDWTVQGFASLGSRPALLSSKQQQQ